MKMNTINPAMRVLIPEIQNPPETFLERLIRGLSNNGVDFLIGVNRAPHTFLEQNIHFFWKPSWNVPAWNKIANLFSLACSSPRNFLFFLQTIKGKKLSADSFREFYRLSPIVNHKNVDLWYFPWILSARDYLPFLEQHSIPFVVSCRGSMVNVDPFTSRGTLVREHLQTIFTQATAVHCVSKDILSTAISLGLDEKKAQVIYPAVDVDYFTPSPRVVPADDVFHITTVGSLIWRKGYEYALQAIYLLRQKGYSIQYHIIGDGPEKQRILYTIDDLGLRSTVILHGRCSPEEVRKILQHSHIFLFSSLSEGLPNAVLEAMACGLPVVTSNCGGVSEAVTNGVEGFIVPLRYPQGLAVAVEQFLINPDLCRRMGEAARIRIEKEFDLYKQVEAFRSLLEQAIRRQ